MSAIAIRRIIYSESLVVLILSASIASESPTNLRPACTESLQRLHLVDVVLNDNFANIIRIMPGLKELVIECNEWVDDYGPIMQSLVAQLAEVSLVDRSLQHSMVLSLQTIGVHLNALWYTHVVFLNSAFVDMVASRLRRLSNVPHLTKLQLSVMGHGWSYDLDEAALNSLKDEGLELELDFRLEGVRL
ncbi:hypothetical protein EV421DRAFT_1747134 [Armillaria borealis]|uniref:F-box domain-containing protein n=1 Tax=Armillaria borealis TaxID=47425 RepID=A0AA39IEJ7_9AGAR|nr:hypothetical protein EV421DRAFT_1747134 [Armillaria borealis]